jgi:hypothetical protein
VPRTYEHIVTWVCACGAAGEVTRKPADDCYDTWDRIVEAHAIAAPDCHARRGVAGVAIHQKDATLPE